MVPIVACASGGLGCGGAGHGRHSGASRDGADGAGAGGAVRVVLVLVPVAIIAILIIWTGSTYRTIVALPVRAIVEEWRSVVCLVCICT